MIKKHKTYAQKEFEEIVKPVIKWLNEGWHPHVKVIIDSNGAELVEGLYGCLAEELVEVLKIK